MKKTSYAGLAIAGLITTTVSALAADPTKLKMTTDIPVSITTPGKVQTSIGQLQFFDGVPTEDTVNAVYDYVDRARAASVTG